LSGKRWVDRTASIRGILSGVFELSEIRGCLALIVNTEIKL
jgi:hypothetical protein